MRLNDPVSVIRMAHVVSRNELMLFWNFWLRCTIFVFRMLVKGKSNYTVLFLQL